MHADVTSHYAEPHREVEVALNHRFVSFLLRRSNPFPDFIYLLTPEIAATEVTPTSYLSSTAA